MQGDTSPSDARPWQHALDAQLVERLSRPSSRPGVIGTALSRSIFDRARHMVGGLPLLDDLQRRRGTVEDEARADVPIVYARRTPRDDAPPIAVHLTAAPSSAPARPIVQPARQQPLSLQGQTHHAEVSAARARSATVEQPRAAGVAVATARAALRSAAPRVRPMERATARSTVVQRRPLRSAAPAVRQPARSSSPAAQPRAIEGRAGAASTPVVYETPRQRTFDHTAQPLAIVQRAPAAVASGASVPGLATGGATIIQRAPDQPLVQRQADYQPLPDRPPAAPGAAAPDGDELVEQVLQTLERRLAVAGERRGVRP